MELQWKRLEQDCADAGVDLKSALESKDHKKIASALIAGGMKSEIDFD